MHGGGDSEQETCTQRAQLKGWLHTEFVPWERGEETDDKSITASDVKNLGEPCKFVLRCRKPTTRWDFAVKAVVGEPVHVDVVLARKGSASARFCYSSYMNQKFEMCMMSHAMVHDDSVSNLALDITEEEQERCTKFLTALNGKASYSYFDAMVLMPMAPKVCACLNVTTKKHIVLSEPLVAAIRQWLQRKLRQGGDVHYFQRARGGRGDS